MWLAPLQAAVPKSQLTDKADTDNKHKPSCTLTTVSMWLNLNLNIVCFSNWNSSRFVFFFFFLKGCEAAAVDYTHNLNHDTSRLFRILVSHPLLTRWLYARVIRKVSPQSAVPLWPEYSCPTPNSSFCQTTAGAGRSGCSLTVSLH